LSSSLQTVNKLDILFLKLIKLIFNIILFRNIDKNKQLSREIRNSMYLIPTLNTQEDVLTVLNNIQSCGEPGAAGNC